MLKKLLAILLCEFLALAPVSPVFAQQGVQLGAGELYANPTAAARPGKATGVSPYFDQALGATNGMVPVRTGGTWTATLLTTLEAQFCSLVPSTCASMFGYANAAWWGATTAASGTVIASAINSALATGHKAIVPANGNGAYISSGTYNSTTGLVTLTVTNLTGIGVGQSIIVSGLTGTGAFASLNGTFTTIAGTAGATIAYTASTGLGATTVTGGTISASATNYIMGASGALKMTSGNILECENTYVSLYSTATNIISVTSNGTPPFVEIRNCQINGQLTSTTTSANSTGVKMDTSAANVIGVKLLNISCLFLTHCFDDANSAFGVSFLYTENILATETFGVQFRLRNTTGGATTGNIHLGGLNCLFSNTPTAANIAWPCGDFENYQGIELNDQLIATGYGNGTPAFASSTPAWNFSGTSTGGAITGNGCIYADNTIGDGVQISNLFGVLPCIYSAINFGSQVIIKGSNQLNLAGMLAFGPRGLSGAAATTAAVVIDGSSYVTVAGSTIQSATGPGVSIVNTTGVIAATDIRFTNTHIFNNIGDVADIGADVAGRIADRISFIGGTQTGNGTNSIVNSGSGTDICVFQISGMVSSCLKAGLTSLGPVTVNGQFATVGTIVFGNSQGTGGGDSFICKNSSTGAVTYNTGVCGTGLPSGTAALGSVLFTNIAAPSTPASGKSSVWTDSTDLRFHDINSAGVIGTTVVAKANVANQWLNSVSTAGAVTSTQPSCANLSGVAASCGTDATNATNITSGTLPTARLSLAPITASLGSDTLMNVSANYFDGPSIAQGATGTWWVSGTVSVLDTTGASNIICKLWDGTTVIASGSLVTPAASSTAAMSLSGFLATPASNLKISCRDLTNTTGKILFNNSANSKDSTISAHRIN